MTTDEGVEITNFTQEDIDNNLLIYVHDGSETIGDSFDFSLADGGEDAVIALIGTFSIAVTAVNDVPTLGDAGGTLSFTENGVAAVIDGTLSVADVDDANLELATITISAGYVSSEDVLGFSTQNGISGSWNSGAGVMTLSGSSSKADYETALESVTYDNTSEDPNTIARTITWVVNDGTVNSSPVTSTISMTAVNDVPTLGDAGGTLSFTENGVAAVIDGTLSVADVDNANLKSATITISSGYVSGEDVLGFTPQNGIVGSWDSGAGVLSLTDEASKIDYETALMSVTYNNTSEDPNTSARTITWVLNDGVGNSSGVSSTISVTALNDAPTLSVNTGASVAEAASVIISTLMLKEGDPDDSGSELTYWVTSAPSNGQ